MLLNTFSSLANVYVKSRQLTGFSLYSTFVCNSFLSRNTRGLFINYILLLLYYTIILLLLLLYYTILLWLLLIINYYYYIAYDLTISFTEDDEEEEEEEELQRAFSQHSEGKSRTYINRFCRFLIFPLLALFYRSQIFFAVCSIFGQLLNGHSTINHGIHHTCFKKIRQNSYRSQIFFAIR